MPVFDIHRSELAAYGERRKRGEILITGMEVRPNGYRLQIVETPRVADAMKLPPLEPKPEPKTPQIKRSERETTNFAMAGRKEPVPSAARPVANNLACHNLPSPEPRTSPSATVGGATVEAVAAPVMVKCFDCGTEHEEGKECGICAPMLRIAAIARERRRAYHLWKSGKGTKPI